MAHHSGDGQLCNCLFRRNYATPSYNQADMKGEGEVQLHANYRSVMSQPSG